MDMPVNASPTALANRLAKLQQAVSQRDHTGLNPNADLGDFDPAWVAEEIAHCRTDPVYFVDTYCKVESDTGKGVVPFTLFPYQVDVLRQWLAHPESITLKARQLGISELAAALALWQVNFHGHNRVIVFSQDETKAREFARKCRIAHEHLPAWLQTPVSDPTKTTTLELSNGSRILPQAATERAARSLNCQLLILDEFAFQEYGGAIFEAAAVTARSAGGRILLISTANGAGDAFHTHWIEAQAGEGMHPIFLPWDIRPGRDATWYANATKGYSAYKKHQEYPKWPAQAFILSGRGRFDTEALQAILAGCTEPIATDLNGGLRVWEMPVAGCSYVVGADPAEGLERGDYSAAVVIDQQTGLDVAWLHGHFGPQEFALYLNDVGRFYNGALLGVERNNHGGTVLLELQNTHGYPNLYAHLDYDAVGNSTPRLGWPTTSKTKPIAIDALAQAIQERWSFHEAAFIGEARTYVVKDNGSTGASGTLHDDRVLSASIALQLRNHRPATTEVVHFADLWTPEMERMYDREKVRIGRPLPGEWDYGGGADDGGGADYGVGWTIDERY
jgi:hypothetical protein